MTPALDYAKDAILPDLAALKHVVIFLYENGGKILNNKGKAWCLKI